MLLGHRHICSVAKVPLVAFLAFETRKVVPWSLAAATWKNASIEHCSQNGSSIWLKHGMWEKGPVVSIHVYSDSKT